MMNNSLGDIPFDSPADSAWICSHLNATMVYCWHREQSNISEDAYMGTTTGSSESFMLIHRYTYTFDVILFVMSWIGLLVIMLLGLCIRCVVEDFKSLGPNAYDGFQISNTIGLQKVGLSAGFEKLRFSYEDQCDKIYQYAITLLSLAYDLRKNNQNNTEIKFQAEDIALVLDVYVPIPLSETMFQKIASAKNRSIEIPKVHKVKKGKLSTLCFDGIAHYQRCGTQYVETLEFLKVLLEPLSRCQREKLLANPKWLSNLIQVGNVECLQMLLLYLETEVKRVLMWKENKNKQSVLMEAVGIRSSREVFLLLSQQLPPTDWVEVLRIRDPDKRTVLHYAALAGQYDILNFLIDTSGNSSDVITATDNSGATFFDYCAALMSMPAKELGELIKCLDPDPIGWHLMTNNAKINGGNMTIIHTLLNQHRHNEINLLLERFPSNRRIRLFIHRNDGIEAITAACNSGCQECKALGSEWKSLILERISGMLDSSGEHKCQHPLLSTHVFDLNYPNLSGIYETWSNFPDLSNFLYHYNLKKCALF